ncbi:MAG: sugar ABC transporter ATP-binding protein [Ruminococcaceae bacterium]|nr:sugar ABC transporter ATP-binding protein [Oscillospiraceae bacterium]
MAEKFIELHHVNKHYGGVHALKDIDFDLNKGEVHCLVGKNGCGKSTMIKVISGVIKPDEGSEIVLCGKRMKSVSPQISMESGVRVIYQDLSLFPNLSVAENIAFNQHTDKTVKGVNWKRINETAKNTLDMMHISLDLTADVSALSIADRQLVAIARALATNAKLLIMDEPTSSLTRKEVDVLFAIVRKLKEQGITVIFVSHKTDEILEIADRITVVRDGVKIATYENNAENEIDGNKLAEMISGHSIEYKQDFVKPGEETVLEVKNLSSGKQYKDISFSLKKGEVLGIIGLLGAGRTELALSLFGMNKPDSGEIYVKGEKVVFKSNRDAIKKHIAYLPEDRLLQGLVVEQNVEDNMSVTVLDRIKSALGLIDLKKRRDMTENWIGKLDIKSAKPGVSASTMSGGNQQKIVVAKWLATDPEILILDQPTNGIDVAAKDAIYKVIRSLAESGISVIIISDEIPEIYYNCPRAILMHKGRVKSEIDCASMSEKEFSEVIVNAQ